MATRIRLIGLEIFVEQINQEKSHAYWTNRHSLEQIKLEEKIQNY